MRHEFTREELTAAYDMVVGQLSPAPPQTDNYEEGFLSEPPLDSGTVHDLAMGAFVRVLDEMEEDRITPPQRRRAVWLSKMMRRHLEPATQLIDGATEDADILSLDTLDEAAEMKHYPVGHNPYVAVRVVTDGAAEPPFGYVAGLTPNQQRALLLYYGDRVTDYAELARLMGLSEKVVRQHLHKAVDKVRRLVE